MKICCERKDHHLDAYQIKTRRDGSWNLSDAALKESIKRFVKIDQSAPDEIKTFFFVSNAGYEDSKALKKIGHNPKKFLKAIQNTPSPGGLPAPFDTTFEELRSFCQCEPLHLMVVLKKLELVPGPGLDSFEAEIAQDHLPTLSACRDLPAAALSQLQDDLITKVYKASCFRTSDPARHLYGLTHDNRTNPKLQAKRIEIEGIHSFIHENRFHLLNSTKDTTMLSARQKKTLELYLDYSFKEDQVAKLDQAGETDPDRTTLLH